MREHRHFVTQVRSNDEQRAQAIDVGDLHAQARIGRVRVLVAIIKLAQAVIDVRGAQTAHHSIQKI